MAEFETILTARNDMRAAIDSAIADVERLKRAQTAKIDPASIAGFSPGQIKAIALGARNMGVSFEEQAAKVRGSLGKIKPAANDAANAIRGFGTAGKASLSGMDGYLGSMASRYLSIGAAIGSATMAYKAFATSDAQLRGLAASLGTTVQYTAGLEGQFKKLANSIARPTDEVIGAFDTWRTRSGLAADVAMRSYSKVAAAAAVAQAPIKEFGESFGVVVQNLKISEAEIPDAINSFLHARRVYGVEINEMMRSLPKLSQVMSDWGYSGASAAATLATAIAAVKPAFKDSMQAGLGLADLFTTLGGKDFLDVIGLNADEAREQLQALQKQGIDPLVGIMRIADEVFSRTGGNFNERLFPNKLDPAYLALRRIWEQWSKMPQAFRESAEAKRELDKQLATAIEGSPAQQLQELKNEFWGLVQAFGSLIDKAGATSGMKKLGLEFLAIAKLIEKMENSRFFKKMFGEEPKPIAATSADTATRGKIPGSELTFVPQTGGEKWTWENFWQHMLQQDRVKGLEAYNDYLDKRKLETVRPEDIGPGREEGALNRPGTPPTQEQIDAKKRTEAEYNSAEERIRRGAELVQGSAKRAQERVDRYYKLNKKDEDAVKNAPVIVAPPLVPQAATEVPPQPAPAPAQSWYQKYLGGFRRPQARPMSAEELPDYRPLLKTSMMPGFGLPVIPSDPKVRNAITGAMIPLNSVRKRISGDAEDPDAPLRSALREMLGLPDPKEPAPWKPGGQWPHPDRATDFSSRRMTPIPEGVLLKRQEEQTKATEDLANEIRDLNDHFKRWMGEGPGPGGIGGGVGGTGTGGGAGPGASGGAVGGQIPGSGLTFNPPAGARGAAVSQDSGPGYPTPSGSGSLDPQAMDPMRQGRVNPNIETETITTSGGRKITVAKEFAPNFRKFIQSYEAAGGVIGPDSGGGSDRLGNKSYHPDYRAMDLNQVGYGIRSSRGKTLPREVEERLAFEAGLYPGSKFKNRSDIGHFEVRNRALALAKQREWAGGPAVAQGGGGGTGSDLDRLQKAIQKQEGYYPGTRGWRNNNPGNVKALGPVGKALAAKYGASGVDEQGHIIFPSREAGLAAHRDFLQGKYHGKSLNQIAASGYAEDPNWGRGVARAGGIDPNKPLDLQGQQQAAVPLPQARRSQLDDELEKRRRLEEPIKLNWSNSVGADGRLGPATQRQASAEALKHADYDLSHDIYT